MKRREWIFSTLIVAVSLVVLWVFNPICFHNNDDKVIQYLAAGYTTGRHELSTVFGGFLWSGFIGILYRICGRISWYTLANLGFIILSFIMICRAIMLAVLKKCSRYKALAITCLIWAGLMLTVLMYFTAALQYTVTAAFVGAGGVAALLLEEYLESKQAYIVNTILTVLLITTSYSIRKQMGLVTLSCVLIILFFKFFAEEKKAVLKQSAIILIAFAIVFGTNAIYEHASGEAAFNSYYQVATRWIDYPHLDIADDTDGVYASVGWDQDLYDAATRWYFMDERVNLDSFNTINAAYSAESLSFAQQIQRTKGLLEPCKFINVQVILWFIILIGANIIAIIKRQFDLKLLTADALFGFFALVCIYFCFIQGRFPSRVYEALVVIYFIPSIILLLQKKAAGSYSGAVIGAMMVLLTIGCMIKYPAGSMVRETYYKTHDADRAFEVGLNQSLETYAIANSDNVYVYDFDLSLPADPFFAYTEDVPKNVLFWGGWTYGSPMYYKQLESNGLTQIYSDSFIDGNVYFCGRGIDEIIVKYMKGLHGDVEPEIIDEFNGIIVYRFTRG